MFFYLISVKNKRFTAYLSDINSELINSYIVVKDNVEKLIKFLKRHEIGYRRAPAEYYYKLRSNNKLAANDSERAARFIALNRTCYNGLYRVNKNGMFNVPLGKYKLFKEKLNLPENSTIKFEKVKDYYAYSWNPELKKLKKKYIGKSLSDSM